MTVSNTTTKLTYTGNGSTRTFGITFPLLSASYLRIIVTDSDGTESEVTNNYTLSTALDSITYPTVASGLDPLPSTKKLTLMREMPLTQEIDLHSGHALNAEELEGGYDKLTYLLQEIKEQVTRSIKYSVAQTDINTAEKFLSDVTTASTAAQNSATSAATSATTASNKASEASTSQVLAAGYATDASNYASAASDSAASALSHKQAAATSAYEAGQAAATAEGAADDAEAAKSVVSGYADDAAGYASAAGLSAEAAAGSASAAEDAKADAVDAKTAAVTAQGKAETAESNAQSAAATAQSAASQLTTHNTDTTAHADIRTLISGKQDTLTAGDNIQIVNNVISATGGGGGGGSANWGSIGGTLSNQTDLKNALDAKAGSSHTHTKSDITDFPSIPVVPTKLSDFTDDLGSSPTHTHSQYLESVSWNDIGSKPESFTPSSHTHTKSDVTDFPAIPTKLSDLTDDLGSNPTHTHSQYLTSVPVATTSAAGKVKPDGTTITITQDGTISASASGGGITGTYDSTNKILTLE